MQANSLTVSAPSRLHFGLLSIGDQTTRKFGGAGLMIDAHRTAVKVSPSPSLELITPDDSTESVESTLRQWQTHFALPELRTLALGDLPVRLKVEPAPRHSGLGSGTQLAFAVATALQLAFDQPIPSTEDLALALGRSKRSAIGSYGFHQGGFLVDRGIADESIAPLDMRIDFPKAWKIVLIQPRVDHGTPVFGSTELDRFQELPPTTQEQADHLASVLRNQIVPTILKEDFENFARAVLEYGYLSGLFYEPIQGGAYASPVAREIVDRIAEFGQYGVGQSSWGPLLFAFSKSEKDALRLVEYLREHSDDVTCHAAVVSADNRGMVVVPSPRGEG